MKRLMMIAAAMLLGSSGAWALGITAGTRIDNNATLTYSAGGVLQPEVNATLDSNGNTAADSFLVDKKIDMVLVTTDSDQIEVTPGQENMITHFAFTNEGNADQNFTFTVSNLDNDEEADYDTDKDNDDVSDLLIQCTYTAADGTTKTETWASSFTLEIKEDGTAECNVSADINDPDNTPETNDAGKGDDGDIMNIELLATAVDASGNAEDNSSSETAESIDVVLADGVSNDTLGEDDTGDTGSNGGTDGHKGDTPSDGKEAARSGYIISTPVLSVEKESCVVSDPVNGDTNPKRIPGAIVRYLFDIENTGTADVSDLNLTDTFNDALDLDGTPDSAEKTESQDDECDCATSGTGISTDTSISGQEMTVQHISVDAGSTQTTAGEKHTCVWVEVEIK